MALVDSMGDSSNEIKPSPLPRKFSPPAAFFLNLGMVLVFSCLFFVFINFPAYYTIYKYRLAPQSISIDAPKVAADSGKSEVITQYEDNTIVIPKIGVKAPILWDKSSGEVMDSLQNGVVHLAGTSHPGEPGNTFLTGHSSNYWWRGGDYNSVFALLPELAPQDEVFVIYHGTLKEYKVKELIEVKKDEVSSYVQTSDERLTMMTCVPVGTNLRRLLVVAELVR